LTTPERVVARTRRMLLAQDPLRALDELQALRADLDRLERELVGRAFGAGASFAAVARALGISRQAAHRRYRDDVTRPPASQIAPGFTKQPSNVIPARDDLAPTVQLG
jgi:DNA invertase Pin-like site-specific DNA recombinase